MKKTRKLTSAILVFTLFATSTTISHSEISNEKLEQLKHLSKTFRNNIDDISLYDTNSGNKWELAVDGSLVKDRDEAMKFLQGVYSVVPFYNSMTVKRSGNDYKIALNNLSAYENKLVIDVAKKWVEEVVDEKMEDIDKVRAIFRNAW